MGRRHLSWKEEHRVSEYQYYEFRALDRRLTPDQQRRLRSLSTRAEISATRFANEYSFRNFRGDPGRLLEEYFDAYLYAANWGRGSWRSGCPGHCWMRRPHAGTAMRSTGPG
jgi:hypothetical protein